MIESIIKVCKLNRILVVIFFFDLKQVFSSGNELMWRVQSVDIFLIKMC